MHQSLIEHLRDLSRFEVPQVGGPRLDHAPQTLGGALDSFREELILWTYHHDVPAPQVRLNFPQHEVQPQRDADAHVHRMITATLSHGGGVQAKSERGAAHEDHSRPRLRLKERMLVNRGRMVGLLQGVFLEINPKNSSECPALNAKEQQQLEEKSFHARC